MNPRVKGGKKAKQNVLKEEKCLMLKQLKFIFSKYKEFVTLSTKITFELLP